MSATVITVAYGVEDIDLAWVPDDGVIIVVHNDELLPRGAIAHPRVTHLHPGCNLGFGAAVNLALDLVVSDRVILCNPDTALSPEHWSALVDARSDEVVTIAQDGADGTPTSVVNGYWNPLAFTGTALRLGRVAPRGGRVRRCLAPLLGSWGRQHNESLQPVSNSWPLSARWGTGAVLSLPTDAIRSVGGFDDEFFLYYEDVDLQQRMANADPALRLRLADVPPAIHRVGGSAGEHGRRHVERLRRQSAARYARRQNGPGWALAGHLIGWTVR